ncbi:hypothetical protein [Microcoleus sp.]|uniref:hypothetical protein n=1 Tax=Microcoleus sp. TaxID=44472 RepID=UPI0035249E9A
MPKVAPGINEALVPTGVRCFLARAGFTKSPQLTLAIAVFKFLFNDDFILSNLFFPQRWQLPNLQS